MQQELLATFKKSLLKGIGLSLGVGIGLTASYLFAVSVGTLNTFSSGSTVSSSQINSNFTTLKTAIESLNTEVQTNLTTSLSLVPTGTILPYAGATAPTGYLLCDNSPVSRTTYADLFAVIGTTWGSGDGSTTFNVPDARAASPTGAGTSTAYTQNETLSLGSKINDQFQSFEMTSTGSVWLAGLSSGSWDIGAGSPGGVGDNSALLNDSRLGQTFTAKGSNGTPRTGNVTKGKQFVVNFIIKY
ncbi:MAG: phage tail protein [Spirochaetota bacterium]